MKSDLALLWLRLSVGMVFLWFGVGKFQGDIWAQTIRTMDVFRQLPWSPDLSVLLIGIIEVVTGTLLILGMFTRWVSVAAAMELAAILFILRFQEIRDIGLLGTTVYMAFSRESAFGIDWVCGRRRKHER
jgi:uncharacterized membrane protein YphA (DoxX/SURF4 family)